MNNSISSVSSRSADVSASTRVPPSSILTLRLYNLLERLLGRRTLWRAGRWLYLGSRRELGNDPEMNGEYALQRWAVRALTQDLGRKLVCVDVGAHVGHWSGELIRGLKESGVHDFVIYAFEPSPAQHTALTKRLGPYGNADWRAVGATTGMVSFSVTNGSAGDGSLRVRDEAPAGLQVEMTTLDAIAAAQGYDQLDLVKVDTEGNDFNVILGAITLFDLERIGILQFEYNWRWVAFGHNLREVFEFFRDRAYLVCRLTAQGLEYYAEWHQELERFIESNYVVLHKRFAKALPCLTASFDSSNLPLTVPLTEVQEVKGTF